MKPTIDTDGDGIADKALTREDNVAPGSVKIKDINGDGKINADDRTPISRDPDFTLSLNTTLKWKGFDFYMDWYGVSGRKIRNGYLSESNSGGSLQGKLNGVKVNYWTPFNPSNEFPRPSHNTNVTYHGSLAIQDMHPVSTPDNLDKETPATEIKSICYSNQSSDIYRLFVL